MTTVKSAELGRGYSNKQDLWDLSGLFVLFTTRDQPSVQSIAELQRERTRLSPCCEA